MGIRFEWVCEFIHQSCAECVAFIQATLIKEWQLTFAVKMPSTLCDVSGVLSY